MLHCFYGFPEDVNLVLKAQACLLKMDKMLAENLSWMRVNEQKGVVSPGWIEWMSPALAG